MCVKPVVFLVPYVFFLLHIHGFSEGRSTMGTFSVGDTGAGSLLSGRPTTTASGTGEWEGFAALAVNPWAMSSNVLPLVSGTRRKVKMKNTMRKIMKMMKT